VSALSRPVRLFKYVVLGGVAGLDLAVWVALVGRLVG
jgi:hypothetical protein